MSADQTEGRRLTLGSGSRIARSCACAAAVVGIGLGAAACGSSSSSSSSSSSAAAGGSATSGSTGATTSAASASSGSMPTVKMIYAAPVADLEVPLIAAKEGFFKKYGVNVVVSLLPQAEAIPALVSGQVQMGVFEAPAPEVQVADGQPLKWLMQWEGHSDGDLLGRNGVTSVKGLSGKTVGISSSGSTSQVLTQLALKQAGVTATLQPLGSVSEDASAYEAGSIDATLLSPPQDLALLKSVKGAKILVHYQTEFNWPGAGLAALSSYTSKNAATTIKVIEGMTAAVSWMKSHVSQTAAIIAKPDDLSVAQAKIGLASMLNIVNEESTLAPSTTDEKTVLGVLKDDYPKAGSLGPSAMVDSSYYNQAVKKVPFTK